MELPLPACGERSARVARRVRGIHHMRGARTFKTARSRTLRRDSTETEKRLWNKLRSRALDGCKFVRQEPIGPYVADFVCRERRLIVEVDGGQHSDNARDRHRDNWLAARNYRVLRFWNNEVNGNIDGVLEMIAAALRMETPPHPTADASLGGRPLPASGER